MARYRVKINGFGVINEAYDDRLERDGERDEVQISVLTTVLDGKVVGVESEKTTPIMGDTSRLRNRTQAGSASDRGGLMTSDSLPDGPMPWLPPAKPRPRAGSWTPRLRREQAPLRSAGSVVPEPAQPQWASSPPARRLTEADPTEPPLLKMDHQS